MVALLVPRSMPLIWLMWTSASSESSSCDQSRASRSRRTASPKAACLGDSGVLSRWGGIPRTLAFGGQDC